MTSDTCVCGHHRLAHEGHATDIGRAPSTHCACCYSCPAFRPSDSPAMTPEDRIAYITGKWGDALQRLAHS